MRTLACSMFVVLLAALSLQAQTGSTLTRPSLPKPEQLHKMGLRQRWHASVPMAGMRDRVDYAQAFDTQVLVQTASGGVAAFDAETGALQWTIRLGRPYRSQHLPAAANRYTFCIGTGLTLYGVDRRTGLTQWSLDTPGILSTSVGIDDLRCYAPTVDGEVYAYVLPLSKQAYEARFGADPQGQGAFVSNDPISNPTTLRIPIKLWDFQTDSVVSQPPVLLSTHVVFANKAGVLYSFERDRNRLGDRFYSRGPITAPIGQQENDLYVASEDYNVYNIELVGARLALRWQATLHSRILDKPIVADKELFVVGLDQGLFCMDRFDGALKWRQPEASKYVASNKRMVFAKDRFGNLLCLDRAKGKVINTWDTRAWGHLVLNEYNDRLYLVSHDGQLLCLHDHAPEYAKPYKHNAAPPKEEKKAPEGEAKEEMDK